MDTFIVAKCCNEFKWCVSSSVRQIKKMANIGNETIEPEPNVEDFSHIFRPKARMELIRISAVVMGIEFCYAAETAFISPTILKIGIRHSLMSLIWCLSPLLGFFLTPIFGSLSDRCGSPLGKRRPFILGLSVGIILGLILVSNGEDIGRALGDSDIIYSLNQTGTYNNSEKTGPLPIHEELVTNSSWSVQPTVDEGFNSENSKSSNSNTYSSTVSIVEDYSHHPWGILFTIIGTVVLDFDADACQSPARAYLLDISISDDHAIGLSTFTVMAGLGGTLGYGMGAVNWDATSLGQTLGGQVRAVFTITAFIYVICVLITVCSFREIPLHLAAEMANLPINGSKDRDSSKKSARATSKFSAVRPGRYKKFVDEDVDDDGNGETAQDDDKNGNNGKICWSQSLKETRGMLKEESHSSKSYGALRDDDDGLQIFMDAPNDEAEDIKETSFVRGRGPGVLPSNSAENQDHRTDETDDGSERDKPKVTAANLPVQQPIAELKQYLLSILHMPMSLRILCLTHLFSAMSLVSYSLYFTDFVGEAVFNGNPQAAKGSQSRQQYENGVRFGCLAMSLYSLSCSIYSLSIDKLIQTFGAQAVYTTSHMIYCLGMFLMACSRHQVAVLILSFTPGILYSTLFTMPFLLVAHYHTNNKFVDDSVNSGPKVATHIRGLGTDVAVVSSMLFLAQFILSSCMGTLVYYTGSTVTIVIVASILSFCGGLCATQVKYFGL